MEGLLKLQAHERTHTHTHTQTHTRKNRLTHSGFPIIFDRKGTEDLANNVYKIFLNLENTQGREKKINSEEVLKANRKKGEIRSRSADTPDFRS